MYIFSLTIYNLMGLVLVYLFDLPSFVVLCFLFEYAVLTNLNSVLLFIFLCCLALSLIHGHKINCLFPVVLMHGKQRRSLLEAEK